ncbi:hypothetical protein [Methylobacterium sp. J-076]|uniref:hypothetical protein n=1 Tax=Methylobacterium sp. J-076 TaxID=2836655 RepID=UPI001FBB3E7E|nr:hypothetical protein [Methylobacterium sp. J-076]MCJ2015720.1 hypothetical protein [Methylobacterium sp. J-076]
MTEDLREGPLTSITHAGPAQKQKPSGRELRRQRRRRRRRGEEMLAWVLVPLICFGIYWSITAGFEVLGTSPGQVWDQLMQVKAMMEKRRA